jgi:hypothetical protein
MRQVYFVLVNHQGIEELVTLYAYISEEPGYKNRYMAHVTDTVNNEILFYESHTSREILKLHLEASIEEYGYIIFYYQEHSLPGFHWYD